MAITKCNECGHGVSTKAESCPNCGAVLRNKTGCLGYVGIAIVILIIIGAIRSMDESSSKPNAKPASKQSSSTSKEKAHRIYKEGETVNIGYMSYSVWHSWWSTELSDNQFLNEKPDAMFLFVNITVRNDDKKSRSIPPFKLIDENGAEYESSSKGWLIDGWINVLDSLNPSVRKDGVIVFDVPTNRSYKLRVSGGYWSGENALIEIYPKQKK